MITSSRSSSDTSGTCGMSPLSEAGSLSSTIITEEEPTKGVATSGELMACAIIAGGLSNETSVPAGADWIMVTIFIVHHMPANIAARYTYGFMRCQRVILTTGGVSRSGSSEPILAKTWSKYPSGTLKPVSLPYLCLILSSAFMSVCFYSYNLDKGDIAKFNQN